MINSTHKRSTCLRAVFYDDSQHVLKKLERYYDKDYLIAKSIVVLEEYDNAHCLIQESDSATEVLKLKRSSID